MSKWMCNLCERTYEFRSDAVSCCPDVVEIDENGENICDHYSHMWHGSLSDGFTCSECGAPVPEYPAAEQDQERHDEV